MTVAEGLGPPAVATSSAVRSCISLQGQPAFRSFISSHWADGGGKAGLGAEGPVHQQCTETHLLSTQRELLQMMADIEKCFLRLLQSSCCWQLVFSPPHIVVQERTGLESGRDWKPGSSFYDSAQSRLQMIQRSSKCIIREMNSCDHRKPKPTFLCNVGFRKESPRR